MDDEFDCISSKTLVFWDVDDFPVPLGKSIDFLPKEMETSLFTEGYKGDVKFIVYSGKKSVESKDHLRYLKMDHQEVDEKHSRLYCMLVDMVASAYYNPKREFLNFMVIAKDSEEGESEFVSTLGELKKRDYNVFLVVPDDCSTLDQAPFPDAHLVWHWSQLFDGEEAQFCSYDSDSDSDCEEVSSLLERSKISDVDCEKESMPV